MENTKKLPVWWIIILAPFGIVLTTLTHRLIGSEYNELKNFLGISQGRMFALLIYTVSTGFAVLIYWFLLKSNNLTLKKAGYRFSLNKKGLFAALICTSVAIFMYPIIEYLMKVINVPMMWAKIGRAPVQQNETQDIFLGLLTAVVLAPLTEDTIFRGYVLEMFRERMNKWFAIIASSIIFAAIHFQFFGPGLTVYMFFWSILTGYLYIKFNNIYPSLIFHALNNIFAYILVPLIFK